MFLKKNENAFNAILSHSEFIEFVCNSTNDIFMQHSSKFNVINTFKIECRCSKTFYILSEFDFCVEIRKSDYQIIVKKIQINNQLKRKCDRNHDV